MAHPLRVLLAEDNSMDAELILRELRRGGYSPEWQRVDSEEAYLAQLQLKPEIILSDYEMPQFSGPRALELLNERALDIPFIIISGTVGEDLAVAIIKQGASDYLLKDRLARLGPAVTHALAQHKLRNDRRQAEEELAESERRYRQLIDGLPVAVYTTDAEGYITLYNENAVALWGRAPVLGVDRWGGANKLFSADGKPLALEDGPLGIALRENRALAGAEISTERPDGTRASYLSYPTPLRDRFGNVVAAMNVLVDITERKKAESQLLRAQRMESIGTLAGGVAHDLHNILSPILMCVSLLKQDLPAGQRDKIIETIEMSAERGADIVKQVLAFGRGLDTRQIRLDVAHVIRDITKIAGRTFPKDIRLEATTPTDLWTITADATQLHQVLLNLCVNARDAMPSGGLLRITAENLELDSSYVSMTPGARPGRHILLVVSDTGTGIPPELFDSIFDPFFTTKPIGKGTGLGLPTVLGIVKSHGGFLQVQSEPGKGTSFKIFLPANQEDLTPAVEETEPEPTPEGQGELILIVDDENGVRLAARAVLEANGYQVVVAADGIEALTVCAQNAGQIRLVLTDVVMPFMDGPALVRALSRMGLRAPIIATTGDGAKGRVAELQSLGVTNILKKPYSAESLLRTLHAALHPLGDAPPHSPSLSS